ncbi:hypothetical protein BDC45DRAFT_518493 [Circinella umbellata]|nr:hypothetical protein BDC45DRAFT_518493 [Circinella umbellata]
MTEQKSNSLNGKVAVITGAASGIGKATAMALAERGAKVVIADIAEEAGEAATQEINDKIGSRVAIFQKTNVTKYKEYITLFQRTEKEFGGVDIVHLNAGTAKGGYISALQDLDDEQDEFAMNVNTMGVIKGTKVAILHLAKRGGGVILTTASTAGFDADFNLAAYCASKHAVIGWTRSMDFLPQIANIRINALCPGGVATNFGNALMDDFRNLPLFGSAGGASLVPMANIDTVVRAALQCIEDESLHGETVLALPGDVIRIQPRPEMIAENGSPELMELYMKVVGENIDYYKSVLKKSLEKYDSSTKIA